LQAHQSGKNIEYSGSEVTEGFVEACRSSFPDLKFFHRDLAQELPTDRYDYLVLAGTLYHLHDCSEQEFQTMAESLLINSFAMARRGIAFNLVTDYVSYRHEDLFYWSISQMLDFVLGSLSRFFTIDHCSPLFEHTVCVYKEDFIASKYEESAFDKYFSGRSMG